jgi:DNA-binding beta-propeller fold protein YncE
MVPLRMITAALVVAGLVAACTSSTAPGQRAAEPAPAPITGAAPAGRVIAVGHGAEGVAIDAADHIVAVAVRDPATLVLLDSRSGQVLGKIPLPGTLRHLQIGPPGTILVPVETADELLQITARDGQLRARTPTGRSPHDAAATADGTVFVTNEFGGSVTIVRASSAVGTMTGFAQPGGVAAAGDTVGVVDVGANTLSLFTTQRTTSPAALPAGNGPTHVITDRHGRFVVADTRGNALLLYQTTPPRQIRTIPMPGNPYGLAYDPARDRLWVTLTARNELVGIDLGTEPPRQFARYPTVRQPNTVAVDSTAGRVIIVGAGDGQLQYLDP